MHLDNGKTVLRIEVDIDFHKGKLVISGLDKGNYKSLYFEVPITDKNKAHIISQLERLRGDIQDYEPSRYEAWIYKEDDNDDQS